MKGSYHADPKGSLKDEQDLPLPSGMRGGLREAGVNGITGSAVGMKINR